MIQFNLLPDVKLAYIKAQQTRRLVVGISLLITAVSIVLLAITLSVDGLQKKHLSDLTRDVSSESSKLQATPDINRILTVQNQLESLTSLHDGKPAASRLFAYLNELTPSTVAINNFTTDFTQQTATISGAAGNLSEVNQYIDTIKQTTYTTGDSATPTPAFSNVVLSSFSLNSGSSKSGQQASYSITLAYDKTIFDVTQNVKLTVPSQAANRDQTSQSTDLFTDTTPAQSTPTNGSNKP